MWYKLAQLNNKIDIPLPDYIWDILKEIQSTGGRSLIVGGAVRDFLLGIKSKDIDFEVYNLSYQQLKTILEKYGRADLVGQSFGVIKFLGPDHEDYDFSLPRTDSKKGVGHKDFDVEVNSSLTPKEAAARRDFTMNAISYDPLTKEVIDPYNGIQDIKNKILRHTSDAFSEDALRVLRGMQFSSRFGFDIAPETAELANSIRDEYKHIPKERIEQEFKKLVQKGIKPGLALDYLYKTGWSINFPEIHEMKGLEQEKEWHPEIWLDEHVKQVMNEAAKIADSQHLTPEEREVLIYAALCHDFAKPATTKTIVKKGIPRITSHGHEEAGGPMAKHFLESIGVNKKIIDQVVPLVENHLNHIHMTQSNNPDSFVKKLAERLHPSSVQALERVVHSDHMGRKTPEQLQNNQQISPSAEAIKMSEYAKQNNVFTQRHPNLLEGKDVLKYTGGIVGPEIGKILAEHRNLILNHSPEMKNRESALQWLHDRMFKPLINGNDIIAKGYQGPKIKEILNNARQAQENNLFNNREEALEWLNNNY